MDEEQTFFDKAIRLQNGLVSHATDGSFEGKDENYKRLRYELLSNKNTKDKVPSFVKHNRDLSQFWQFIKHKYRTYAERRNFIWEAFAPLLEYLEANDQNPGIEPIEETLKAFNADNVHSVWQKALERRINDPDGAITASRTLLETVCKHILDDANIEYAHDDDLPKLYRLCAKLLNLAPEQHQEEVFKAILGNCQAVVKKLGEIRNKIGDAHGKGRQPVRVKPRHAELAVNLAGTMASFLVQTWEERNQK